MGTEYLGKIVSNGVDIESVRPRRDHPHVLAVTVSTEATPASGYADRVGLERGWPERRNSCRGFGQQSRIGSARSDVDAIVRVGELEIVHHGSADGGRQTAHNLLGRLRPVAFQGRP